MALKYEEDGDGFAVGRVKNDTGAPNREPRKNEPVLYMLPNEVES